MEPLTPRVRVLAAMVLTAAAMSGGLVESQELVDPGRVPWTRLEFEARKLFAKGTTEVRLASVSRSDLGSRLIASPRGGALKPAGPRLALLEMKAAFAGRRTETSVWFEPRRASALQRHKLRLGRKGYEKTYRFAGDGVFSRRRSPADARQGEGPIEDWGNVEDTFYDYPEGHGECGPIADPSQVLYLVSAAGPEPLRVCSFSDKTLHHVELKPRGTRVLDVDYERGSKGGKSRRRGRVEVAAVVLEARPVDAESGEDFEFLGLEGDVEIFLDGRIPVQIVGRLPGLGRVRIKLVSAELVVPTS